MAGDKKLDKVDMEMLKAVKAQASQQIVAKEPTKSDATRAKGGRPKKEVRAEERVVLLLTTEELTNYQIYCSNIGMSQSAALRYLLKQANAI